MVVMFAFMSKCTEWDEPIASRMYCGKTSVSGEMREVGESGNMLQTALAGTGGAVHHPHIH